MRGWAGRRSSSASRHPAPTGARWLPALWLLLAAGASACVGSIGSQSSEGSGGEVPGAANAELVGVSGLRRLTIDEYDNTLQDLLLDETRSSDLLLPKDARNPFDNDYTEQLASQALIEGAYLLAADAAGRLMGDAAKRDKVIGCVPSEPADAACFASSLRRAK